MALHDTINITWLIGGDFYEVVRATEKFGGNPISKNRCNKFMR